MDKLHRRSAAVPLDVEGLTRPPLAAQCPLRRPGVGVVLLSHCWLWGRGGLGTRCMHRPRAAYPGSLRGVAAPLTSLLCPCATRHTLTGPILIPCSVVPPPRSSSSTYRILTPAFFLGPLRFVTSAYPPALLTPRLARPSYPGFTAGFWSELWECKFHMWLTVPAIRCLEQSLAPPSERVCAVVCKGLWTMHYGLPLEGQ